MKLIIIDDDPIVSQSLKMILEHESTLTVAEIGQNGKDAIHLYEIHQPDVVLMDIRMPVLDGIEAGKIILQKYPEARIVYLTTFLDQAYIQEAVTFGARGYILKQDFENITPSLNAVMAGQIVFGNEIIPHLNAHSEVRVNIPDELTHKEFELIQYVANGLSNKEIALKLYLSEGTVRNYLSIILEKLNLRDRTQLAIYYYKNIVS